ncbi:MAG: hypothetical protein ACRDRU_22930, partial [Pseudonocardiaceae bacterium]
MPGDVHDRFFAGLSLLQADGQACVVCARRLRGRGLVWVPVGLSRTVSQVFACVGECADRAVAPVALVVGDEALSAAGVAYLAVVGAVGDDVRWINPDDVVHAVIAAVVPFVVAAELR